MHTDEDLHWKVWIPAVCICLAALYLYLHSHETLAYSILGGFGVVVLCIAICAAWRRSPARCLVHLQAMDPRRLNALNPTHRAQRCLAEALQLLQSRCNDHQGNKLAHEAYSAGVAFGFYAKEFDTSHDDLLGDTNRGWTRAQLKKIREIGVRHGKLLRHQVRYPYV